MLVPYEWMRELVPDLPDVQPTAEALTMAGANVEAVADSVVGPVLDVEVTANRPDCLCVLGIAREAAAALERSLQPGQTLALLGVPERVACGAAADGPVEILDADLCGRYVGMVIEDVRVGPSPSWLADRLTACGIRPILNVVDVTNYVMVEMGQPLHAFDLDRLADGRVIVRRARRGERITTLDGQERLLADDALVIADPGGPVAVAGVMGGLSTEVTASTRRVLIESANFSPRSVWHTSRQLGLDTEASLRFKRGVDIYGARVAVHRVAELIAEIGAGVPVLDRVYDAFPAGFAPVVISLRVDRVNELLGTDLAPRAISALLARLGFGVDVKSDGYSMLVRVPSFRSDVTREVDLVEEVARLHGYDRIPATLVAGQPPVPDPDPLRAVERVARRALVGCGLSEVVTAPLVSPADLAPWSHGEGGPQTAVRLLNPLSDDMSVMRTTLVPGLLRCVARNRERRSEDLALFEVGRAYLAEPRPPEPVRERRLIAAVVCGAMERRAWNRPRRSSDFFDIKGCLEAVLSELKVDRRAVRFRPGDGGCGTGAWPGGSAGVLAPGRGATVWVEESDAGGTPAPRSGVCLGYLGQIAPAVAGLLGVEGDQPVWAFEVDLEVLSAVSGLTRGIRFEPLPKYPPATRDIAVVVPRDVPCDAVLAEVRKAGGELLVDARLFDVYEGPQVPSGKRSLAFSLTWRAPDRTLTVSEVEEAHARIVEALTSGMGLSLRA